MLEMKVRGLRIAEKGSENYIKYEENIYDESLNSSTPLGEYFEKYVMRSFEHYFSINIRFHNFLIFLKFELR